MATVGTIYVPIELKDGITDAMDKITKSAEKMESGFSRTGAKIVEFSSALQIFGMVKGKIDQLASSANEMIDMYQFQLEQETKLETVMRKRMGSTNESIQSMKDYASALQEVGIYGDEMLLAGAQELATFTDSEEAVKNLLPALANLTAQQAGFGASAETLRGYGTMMGKVLAGNISGLSRMGYVFSDAEAKMIQFGTEEERSAALAQIIESNVGRMNEMMAKTTAGKIIQLNNALGDTKEQIGKTLIPFKQFFTLIKSKLQMMWYEQLQKAIMWVQQHIQELARVFTIAIGVMIGALTLLAIKSLIVGAKMAAMWIMANPVAAGIIAGILLLMLILARLGTTVEQVCSFIGGVFGSLYAIGYNIFAGLWNYIAGFVEFFENVFKDPLGSVQRLFENFAITILGFIEPIVEAIDKITGTDLSGAISKFKSQVELAKAQSEFKAKYIDGKNIKTTRKMEEKSIINTAIAGANKGSEIGKMIQSGIDELASKAEQIQMDTPMSELNFDSNGNLMTAEQNTLEIDDDFKRLLSEQALREYQVNYAQITPNFTIENMEVNKDADADSIIDKLANAIEEMGATHLASGGF